MKDTIQTNIVYQGDVTITVKSGSKIIKTCGHNSGLQNLFKIVAKALSGNMLTSGDLPAYIDLRYTSDDIDGRWETCLINLQSLTQRNYTQENGLWVTKLASGIPYSELNSPPNLFRAREFRLYLMSEALDDLAYIQVDTATIESITAGSQAIVEWVLRLSNG